MIEQYVALVLKACAMLAFLIFGSPAPAAETEREVPRVIEGRVRPATTNGLADREVDQPVVAIRIRAGWREAEP